VTRAAKLEIQYAGAIGLLCAISPRITDPDDKACLIEAVQDWCDLCGWTLRITLDRVDVEPPAAGGCDR